MSPKRNWAAHLRVAALSATALALFGAGAKLAAQPKPAAPKSRLGEVFELLRSNQSDHPEAKNLLQPPTQATPRDGTRRRRRPIPASPRDVEPGFTIPLATPEFAGEIEVDNRGGLISLIVRDAPLKHVLEVLAQSQGLNVVATHDITASISIHLNDVPLEDALTAIVSVGGYSWTRQNNIILVTDINSAVTLPPDVQGRQLRVFQLDFVPASEVDPAIQGLLSPVGQAFTPQASVLGQAPGQDNRRMQDFVVVEDLPAYLSRIEQYLLQIDQPPRQVMIEAHVLQVDLRDSYVNGVNILYDDFNAGGRSFSLETAGFANPLAPQAFFFTLDATDVVSLVEMLEVTTDAKTLASPKVLVLHGQRARIQVGESIGFRVTTTTQTSTLESVDFLDVGVVLEVTPFISRDGQVVMHVKPEVSSGRLNPDTQLPEEETTEVETDVLLPNGKGMVIGGLIQEDDSRTQSKIPFVGDLPLVGRLFQRQQLSRERTEIIIVLVPRVAPYDPVHEAHDQFDVHRSRSRLFHGALKPNPRPWEPRLYDAIENPRHPLDLIPRVKWPRREHPAHDGEILEHPVGAPGVEGHCTSNSPSVLIEADRPLKDAAKPPGLITNRPSMLGRERKEARPVRPAVHLMGTIAPAHKRRQIRRAGATTHAR